VADMPNLGSAAGYWTLYAALPIRVLLLFASLSAVWICFRPGNLPRRRILRRVLGPAALSLVWFAITIVRLFAFSTPRSVLESEWDRWQRGFANLSRVQVNLGAGFYFGLAGLLLLGAGLWRLAEGPTTLPVRFGMEVSASCQEGSGDSTRAVLVFSTIALVLPLALDYLLGFVLVLLPNQIFRVIYGGVSWSGGISLLASSSAPALGALYVLRHELKTSMRRVFNLSYLPHYGLALALPALAIGLPRLVFFYGTQCVQGTAAVSPDESSPLHMLSAAWLVILVAAALMEEIGWRGYLQPILVGWFGIRHAIFLVGLVWSAYHFASDLNGKSLLGNATASLAARMAFCVAFATVLGWLRLRTGSILPVTLMHAANNVLILSVTTRHTLFPTLRPEWVTLGIYAVIGYLLFRYWPPPQSSS